MNKSLYRVRFAPNSDPCNIQREAIHAFSPKDVKNIFGANDCMVLGCVDVAMQEQAELAMQIVEANRDAFAQLRDGLNEIADMPDVIAMELTAAGTVRDTAHTPDKKG